MAQPVNDEIPEQGIGAMVQNDVGTYLRDSVGWIRLEHPDQGRCQWENIDKDYLRFIHREDVPDALADMFERFGQ